MSLPGLVMFAAVMAALAVARWNMTAFALAMAYLVVQLWWLADEEIGVGALFMVDIAVVTLVFAKAAAKCDERLHRCGAHTTLCDRAILALFLFGTWPAYVANVSEYNRWWALWWIALAQLLCAIHEGFREWRRAKALSNKPGAPSPGSLRAAWAGGGQWLT
jgi:hypothetical protein